MFGTQDIILLGIIVVVLFGATRLPQLGKGLGEAIGNFKKAINQPDTEEDLQKEEKSQKEAIEKKDQ